MKPTVRVVKPGRESSEYKLGIKLVMVGLAMTVVGLALGIIFSAVVELPLPAALVIGGVAMALINSGGRIVTDAFSDYSSTRRDIKVAAVAPETRIDVAGQRSI